MSDSKGQTQNSTGLLRKLAEMVREKLHASSEHEALREAVEEIIEKSSTESGTQTAERMLLENILKLKERHVGDCMVPRADIIAVDAESNLNHLIALMAEHAHSRIPVYNETLDETVGMVHMKDVLSCLAKHTEKPIRSLLRPVLFVAPSMMASKLLLQMRQTRQHMAMVIDEFGGIDGLVTIEDLVEEVVGEIEDEHDDPAVPYIVARADGALLVDARLEIEEFEKRVGKMLSDEERETIDTVGGYVFHLAGHIPSIGEKIEAVTGATFEILETDSTRIKRVRVRGVRPTTAKI